MNARQQLHVCDRARRVPMCAMIAAALVMVFGLVSSASAVPRFKGAMIRYHGSIRVKGATWATLSYSVINPDSTALEVTVALRPKKQRNVTIFTETVTVEPGTLSRFEIPVVIGTVRGYDIDLIFNDTKIESMDILIELVGSGITSILFLNDSLEMHTGQIHQNSRLRNGSSKAVLSNFKSASRHWVQLDKISLLVITRPDLDMLASRQMRSIMEYTARGGTTVFADPEGIMAAARTILAEMLPVTPIRVRKADAIRDFNVLGMDPIKWPDDVSFLESVPRGDGLTIAEHEDFPLIRWRRFGVGYVGITAVNPSGDLIKQLANFGDIYGHFLSSGDHLMTVSTKGRPEVLQTIDALTGIKIPGPERIRAIIAIYLALVIGTFGWGVLRRRSGVAWTFLAVVAVVGTAAILELARAQLAGNADRKLTVIDVRTIAAGFDSSEQIINLFSSNEIRIDLDSKSADVRLAPYDVMRTRKAHGLATDPAAKKKREEDEKKRWLGRYEPRSVHEDRGEGQVLRDPAVVSIDNGSPLFKEILVRANSTRCYSASVSSDVSVMTGDDFPTVSWTETGAVMEPWTNPLKLKPRYAFLLCEAGYLPVRLDGSELSMLGNARAGRLIAASSEWSELVDLMLNVKAPAPSLLLLSEQPYGAVGHQALLDGGTRVHRTAVILPVRQDMTGEKLALPHERIALIANRGAMIIMRDSDGSWRTMIARQNTRPYEFRAMLPVGTSAMRIEKMTITFAAENRGRNLTFSLAMAPFVKGSGLDTLPAIQEMGGQFIIDGVPKDGYINPVNGQFRIQLSVDPIKSLAKGEVLAVRRVNSWTITEFKIAAQGTLPEINKGVF